MTEHNLTYDQQQHVESHAPYIKIFLILLVLTILEYFYAMTGMGLVLLIAGLMALAITKAALVGMYFMHLKFEGRWVYLMLVPACILAMVLVSALWPDMVLHEAPEDEVQETEVVAATP